jgi:hypothetical protein
MAAYGPNGFEDLSFEAEGPAMSLGQSDGFDGFESELSFDGFDGFESEEPFEGEDSYESDMSFSEFEGEDSFEGEDYADMGEGEDSFEADMFEDAMAYAVGAESEDEFLGRLVQGIKKVASKAAPIIGSVARAAAPIISKLPGPYGMLGGMAAKLLGNLRFEGSSETDALDAFAEAAAVDRRAIPVVAGVAARTLVKNQGARMSPPARKAMVKHMKAAANTLVRAGGTKAIRALPKIARSVARTAAARGTPPAARARIVRRTVAKVAARPALLRRLSRPSPAGVQLVRTSHRTVHSYNIPGPARITIRPL